MFALKGELHSCFRSHFLEKPVYIYVSAAVCRCFLEREPKDCDVIDDFQYRGGHVSEVHPEGAHIGSDLL